MRITINEELAKRAKEAYSFSDYKAGSATNEYISKCEEVEAKANSIDPKYQDQINKLIDRFTSKLGEWINKKNSIDASFPSVMIAGPAKYNWSKRDKQMNRLDNHFKEYDEIKKLKNQILTFTPKLEQDDEIAKLTKEVEEMKNKLEEMKSINAHYRKHGNLDTYEGLSEMRKKLIVKNANESWYKKPYADFEFTSLRNRMKTREENLIKLTAPKQESKEKEINDDIKIVENTELNRLQILFNDIPSVEVRNLLKSKGFRWSPTNKAWQRQLTSNALWDLKHYILPELA